MVKKHNPEEYEKYRWFQTSSRKLVIGGKNAEQNEEIVKNVIESGKNLTVMHTKHPGSPFAIIKSESPNKKDIEETAIFTGCFSRAWREKKKKTSVDIFKINQVYKSKGMKPGTFGVKKPIETKTIELKLYLTTQLGKIRAIPQEKKKAVCITPGNTPKEKLAEQIAVKQEINLNETIQALPTGGSQICS